MNRDESGAGRLRRAYIVDDDQGFRSSLLVLLESNGWSVEVFASAAEFAGRAALLEPGILLLDLHLGGMSGLDLLECGPVQMDRFAVVMMTGAGEIETAVRSIKAGAADFLEKPFASPELFHRLDSIGKDFAATLEARGAQWEARRRVASLSGRERHVLERLLSGASNKLIARDLALSPRTIEMHRARMLDKLGVATTAEALELGRLAGIKPLAVDR
jgi:two-component system response regulator FixJ